MQPRQALLDDDFIHELNMEEYALNAYEQTIRETPVLPDDSPEEKRRREIAYLNIRWFMATLLDRMTAPVCTADLKPAYRLPIIGS